MTCENRRAFEAFKRRHLSTERPGFTELVIRAVDPTETPLIELDLRGQELSLS